MFYDQWQSSPFADEYLARMGVGVMEALGVGNRAGPNLLAISFSTLDKVGHDYGPHSHEIQDVLVRLDRTIGDLLTALDRLVGAGSYTVALSADHGIPPVPERMRSMGFDAGRVSAEAIVAKAEASMSASLGTGRHVVRFVHDYLYLEPGAVEQLRAQPRALRALLDDLRTVAGVSKAYWKDDLAANDFNRDAMGRRAALSYDPDRSGDVMVVFKPYWIASTGDHHARVGLRLRHAGAGAVDGEGHRARPVPGPRVADRHRPDAGVSRRHHASPGDRPRARRGAREPRRQTLEQSAVPM